MSGLRCLALDADAPALAELSYLLSNNARVASVASHTDVNEAARASRRGDIDVVFVCLVHHNPNDINETFNTATDGPLFVAMARTDEHAINAYKVGAIDFLLKPVTAEKIDHALSRVQGLARPRVTAMDKRITGERHGAIHLIDIREVLFIRSNGDYTIITSDNGEFVSRFSLAKLAEDFEADGLVRIHRQWLVPISRVEAMHSDDKQAYVIVQQSRIPVARRCVRSVRDLLR